MSQVHADDAEKVKFHKQTNRLEIRFSIEGKDLDGVGDTVFVGYIETSGENGKSRYIMKDALSRVALGVSERGHRVKEGLNVISLAVGDFSSIDFFEELPSGRRVRNIASGVEFPEAVSSADTTLTIQLISKNHINAEVLVNFKEIKVIK